MSMVYRQARSASNSSTMVTNAFFLLLLVCIFSTGEAHIHEARKLLVNCPPNGYYDPNVGKCVCKSTDRWNAQEGACCPPNGHYDWSTGKCYCKGTNLWTGTACCPPNGNYNFNLDKCVCDNHYYWDGTACKLIAPVVNPPTTYCGDGVCNGYEQTSTCPWDCGIKGPDGSVPYLAADAGLLYQNPMPNNGKTSVYSGGRIEGKYIPISDGCTIQPAEYKGHIQPACYSHDFCYTCGGWFGLNYENCDAFFVASCHSLCEHLIGSDFWTGEWSRRMACGSNCDIMTTGLLVNEVTGHKSGPAGKCGNLGSMPKGVLNSLYFLTYTPHIYGECERWGDSAPKTC